MGFTFCPTAFSGFLGSPKRCPLKKKIALKEELKDFAYWLYALVVVVFHF